MATRLLAVDIDGKNVMQLIKPKVTQQGGDLVWNPRIQDNVISWLDNDPDHILVQLAIEDRLFPSVYKLNIRTNRQQKVKSYKAGIFQWFADENGELRNGAGFTEQRNIQSRKCSRPGIHTASQLGSDGRQIFTIT